ncbi:uncharacterized protein LOC143228931 isoform X2 [Tachypleus tridentatus]|uniref:uncharacterized protein LOC143228931 isoform X2 n=1 Tax=Tachypleus tridentatus TaxID=6853 RepID=UPI003FCF36BC
MSGEFGFRVCVSKKLHIEFEKLIGIKYGNSCHFHRYIYGQSFPKKSTFQNRRMHQGNRNAPFICPVCKKPFKSYESERTHFHYQHTSHRNFACNICGKVFTHKHAMLQHRLKHSEIEQAIFIY